MAFFRVPGVLSAILAALAVAGMRAIPDCHANAGELPQARPTPPPPVTVRWTPDPTIQNRVVVEVTGLDVSALTRLRNARWELGRWQQLLSVYAVGDTSTKQSGSAGGPPARFLPPVAGAYKIQSDALRFEPQYPLDPRIVYHAVFRPDLLPGSRWPTAAPVRAEFKLPEQNSRPTTRVTAVYPSADVLPENLLKFYVHFSAPMSRGRIYEHIHLLSENGKEVELPFLEIDEELWDSQLKRLTLFIDPGRIKRGVLPLEEIGPALESGKRYSLVIDREFRDASGGQLRESFRKSFAVGAPDRDPPDPTRWLILPPRAETTDAVKVNFLEPMDEALTRRLIRVKGPSGEFLEGEISLDDGERQWSFRPGKPWRRGSHSLVIQTTIEDLAGNNIGKPFDVDLFERVEKRVIARTVEAAFEVR